MKKMNYKLRTVLLAATIITGLANLSQATTKLPLKKIKCDELRLDMTLNSHRILFEGINKKIGSYEISVDQALYGSEELYLQYLRKECVNNPNEQPGSCRFHFAVYTVLPNLSVPNSNETLTFDFMQKKIFRFARSAVQNPENKIDVNSDASEVQIPDDCINLASEFVAREDLLNERSKQK